MHKLMVTLLATVVLVLASLPARADDDPAFLSIGAGVYDINDDKKAVEARMEYRFAQSYWMLKPFFGASATTDAAAYVYGGFLVDIYLSPRWVLTPNAAVGLYHDGSGKDLGHVVEFRTGLELAYRFDNRSRLGIAFHHISNASLGDKNPGTELLTVVYSFPFDSLAK